jgi:hypothetical protein
MAIEINVKRLGTRAPALTEVALPPDPLQIVLPRTDRINLTVRRRRLRRLQQALGTAAWVAGGTALLFFTAAGLLSLH